MCSVQRLFIGHSIDLFFACCSIFLFNFLLEQQKENEIISFDQLSGCVFVCCLLLLRSIDHLNTSHNKINKINKIIENNAQGV